MIKQSDILISGVGGQGTLLASRIIGGVAIKNGCDVKVSEVHGMSQRGGSVTTYVRFSDKTVFSPILDPGRADIVLAFEILEAYRSVSYLKEGGFMIINAQEIRPMPVITGEAELPNDIVKKINGFGIKTSVLDAGALAKKAGSIRAANLVLIGKLSRLFDFPKAEWIDTIQESVKPDFVNINIKAFELGYADIS